MTEIQKAAVIGAGVMGASIAAHIANAGTPVVLLDIVPEGSGNRSVIAEQALENLLNSDPPPFMHKKNAKHITTGNMEDHLGLLGECDWIIEAVTEREDIKHATYEKIERARKTGSIVSSNTSTIPLKTLVRGMPEAFARDFLITHFFNPPRYMRLLELVAGEKTRPGALDTIRRFADLALGKTVIGCKDTPGFIANRIGIFWLQCGVVEAMDAGLNIEEADSVAGRPMGIPKTGVFGLLDMVGLDLMPHVLKRMHETLPEDDPFHAIYREPELINKMIADGYTGRKGKGGFYRLNTSSGEKVKEAIHLQTGEYAPATKSRLQSVDAAKKGGLRALVEHPDKGGRYAWRVLSRVLSYAAHLVPGIADDITAVDAAMRLGYNWKYGPFELIDQLGASWFAERLAADGMPVPKLLGTVGSQSFYRVHEGRLQYFRTEGGYRDVRRPAGVLLLSDIKRKSRPLARNRSASLWDIGGGVLCLEFHSKMNSLDLGTMSMIHKAIARTREGFKALVIYNEGANFSVGANIGLLMYAIKFKLWFFIRYLSKKGQNAYKALKYAPFPVVGAPSNMALGGGCEILLHCDAVQAHSETYAGLVEAGVGIVPAWGGCKEMLFRWKNHPKSAGGPMPPVVKAFEIIGTATMGKSAAECKDFLFLNPGDGVTMNRDRLLADAKARALALAENYLSPEKMEISLPGKTAAAALGMAVEGFRKIGQATPHDVVVSKALAHVLSGGETDITETLSEDDILALEREALTALSRHPASLQRIQHMIETGKPLRN